MKHIGWALIEVVSRTLERDERDAVLGDVIESGDGYRRGLSDVCGLVVRRQLALWRTWRPWLAAFGLTLPGSLLLMGSSLSLSMAGRQLIDPDSLRANGTVAREPWSLLFHVCLLIGWAWTGGFVVGKLSRRTVWASALLSVLPCSFCLSRFHVESMSRLSLLLFLPFAICGAVRGVRATRINSNAAIALAAIITALTVFTRSEQSSWLISAALIWPAWYLAATATRELNQDRAPA